MAKSYESSAPPQGPPNDLTMTATICPRFSSPKKVTTTQQKQGTWRWSLLEMENIWGSFFFEERSLFMPTLMAFRLHLYSNQTLKTSLLHRYFPIFPKILYVALIEQHFMHSHWCSEQSPNSSKGESFCDSGSKASWTKWHMDTWTVKAVFSLPHSYVLPLEVHFWVLPLPLTSLKKPATAPDDGLVLETAGSLENRSQTTCDQPFPW